MANWSDLKAAVASIVKTNGNKEITGQLLQNVLNNIISNVGLNSSFAGIATPETNPGTPDGNVFYLATTAGAYSNFNGIVINSGEAVILEWKGSWVKKDSGFATKEKLSELEENTNQKLSELGSKVGFISKTYQLVAGEDGSSKDNRVSTNIKKGETFYVLSETDVMTTGLILFGIHKDGTSEVVLSDSALLNQGYIKRTAKEDIVYFGLSWYGVNISANGTLIFKALCNYAKEVKDNEIKLSESISEVASNVEKRALIADVPIITKTIYLKVGVGHSSNDDRIDCLINKGDNYELRFDSPLADNVDSAVWLQYEGEPKTTQKGLLFNHQSQTFIAEKKIISIGFYIYGGLVTEDSYITYRLINNLETVKKSKSDADIIRRNYDKDNIVDAIGFPRNLTNRFTFLHSSDTHGDADRHNNVIQYMNNKDYIIGLFNTGDIQESNFTTSADWFINSLNDTDKLVTLTIGNHEVGNSKNISLCGNNNEVFEKFIAPIKDKNGLVTNGTNYWYKDFAIHKIRVISLYEYDNDDVYNGEYRIQRGRRCLSQAQIDWLLNLLYSTPTDYAVIMLTHQNPTYTNETVVVNDDWAYSQIDLFPQNCIDGNPLTEIIDAWINGSLMQKEWSYYGDASYLPKITTNIDFSTRGKGEFIGWFFGHTHADAIGHITDYPNQHWFCVTCATAEDRHLVDDLPRIIGQKSEDAFNVVSVDRENRYVYIVRVGSNMSNELVERKFIKVQY